MVIDADIDTYDSIGIVDAAAIVEAPALQAAARGFQQDVDAYTERARMLDIEQALRRGGTSEEDTHSINSCLAAAHEGAWLSGADLVKSIEAPFAVRKGAVERGDDQFWYAQRSRRS